MNVSIAERLRRDRRCARRLVGSAAGLVIALGAVAGADAASPGQQCRVEYAYPYVFDNPDSVVSWSSGFMYEMAYGQWFRVVAYGHESNGDPTSYYGHGAGRPDGYIGRWTIDQPSCKS
ncbi:hypothetical protein [Patulibacter defluvii]|uniref:hypothetical protein n=1 Tax=Patulibacter defluvii TaxID=3095358 RepID=UPI002A754DB9|nr:hypothetical protein [Patulibacter sp. DM4]